MEIKGATDDQIRRELKRMELRDATNEQIEQELARRKMKFPAGLEFSEKPDFSPVIEMVKENIQHLITHGCEEKDIEHYLYETATECCFVNGERYWKWLNQFDG